jgi:two-component system, chemotaxis family, sensor kinase CheA
MQTRGMTIGLYVDELVGRSDIVIKSLAENYMAIPGLSGASILGDGEVCLMLDPTAILDLAKDQATAVQ